MDITLVMFRADGSRRDFSLPGERWVIGRTNACDLRIPISSVSRQHCVLEVDADKNLRIRDLGSSNGTYINDERVQEVVISAGDRLSVGPVVFTVVIDGEPSKITPVPTVVETKSAGEGSRSGPQALDNDAGEMPDEFGEPELHSPTVDLDDPIAALEALSEDSEDDDEIPMFLDDDEEESEQTR